MRRLLFLCFLMLGCGGSSTPPANAPESDAAPSDTGTTTEDASDSEPSDSGADAPTMTGDYAPSDGPKPKGTKVVVVKTEAELKDAIGKASPGDEIAVDGAIKVNGNVGVSRAGTKDAPIFLRANAPGATLELCSNEGFLVSASDWVFDGLTIKGVCPSEDGNEHAFHLVGGSDRTIIRHNKVINFKSHVKLNGSGTPLVWPDDTWYIDNLWMDDTPQPGNKPFNALNIDGGDNHVIRGNRFVDLVSVQDRRASAIYPKLTTRNVLVEQNFIVCRKHVTLDRTRAGISTGESGPTSPYCDGDCANVGNIYRNNVAMFCDGNGNSFGIGIGYEKNTVYLHNTVHGVKWNFWSGASGSDVRLAANLLHNKWLFNGTTKPTLENNLEQGTLKVFASPDVADFTLVDGAEIRGKVARDPKAPHDFCGHPRAAMTDLGVIDYSDARASECVAKLKAIFAAL